MRKPFWMYPTVSYFTVNGVRKGRLLKLEGCTMTVIPSLRDRMGSRLRWRIASMHWRIGCFQLVLGDALRSLADRIDGGT